ncbi:MAG: RloB family protein [Gemmataceae bacterium]
MSKAKQGKKPLSKKVVTLLEQLQRRHGIRELEERFLIVCEDGKSAPNYFEAFKKHYNLSAASVKVAGSGGRTQPVQVVEVAVRLMNASSGPESGTEPFDQVWCVIDGDYGEKIANARAKAEANDIHLAVTTMCFEYWVLLHYEENDTATMDCYSLERALRSRGHIPDYEKGKCDFSKVVPHAELASERAKKLRAPGIRRNDLPENQNPCSEIYELVDAILSSRT